VKHWKRVLQQFRRDVLDIASDLEAIIIRVVVFGWFLYALYAICGQWIYNHP
jgi:hypothetical protein